MLSIETLFLPFFALCLALCVPIFKKLSNALNVKANLLINPNTLFAFSNQNCDIQEGATLFNVANDYDEDIMSEMEEEFNGPFGGEWIHT
jgi:hypothetical protein